MVILKIFTFEDLFNWTCNLQFSDLCLHPMTGWKLSTAISPQTSRAWRPLWTRPSCPTQSSRVSFWRPKNSWHWWMWNTPRPQTDVKFSLKWTCLLRRTGGHLWIRYSHHPKVKRFQLSWAPDTADSVQTLLARFYFISHLCREYHMEQ